MIDQNSQFFAILTAVGEAKQANATALGLSWTFSQMGVGDANGTDPIPNRAQTKLINEWRRAPLNQVRPDPANPNIIITEQVIPPDVGGKWIRELALYDADGDMVAVANCAPSFKALLAQGTGKTQVIRMNFIVASTANIVLKIDPAVVLATREYVDMQIIEALAKLDFKHSVLVATTANIVLSGIQTVDGVLLPADARVLVKDQTQAKDNGIYVVPAGGAWKRAQDADASVEVTPGLFVSVEKGTAHGDSVWQLVTDAPINLGTTPLTFEVVAGRTGVVAGTYRSLTVDKNGRVIAGTNPATLAENGITDGVTKKALAEAIAGVVAKTGATLTGSLTLANGTNDSPEFGWSTPTTTVYMDVVNNSLRAYGAIDGGETLFPLDLNLKTKAAYVFGNSVYHSGNFDPLDKIDNVAGVVTGAISSITKSKLISSVAGATTDLPPNAPNMVGMHYVFANKDFSADLCVSISDIEGKLMFRGMGPVPGLGVWRNVFHDGNFNPAAKINGDRCATAGFAGAEGNVSEPYMQHANGSVVYLASKAYSVFGFQFVKGPTGYIKFPDFLGGFMLQWTKTPQLSTQTTYTWNFPVRFPNEVFGVSGTMIGVSQGPLEVSIEPTTSSVGFAIGIVTAAVGRSFVWAWGY